MPLNDVVVNGKPVKVLRYISNSLTEEACSRYGLFSVDLDILHTDLSLLDLKIITPDTYGLVYYLPTRPYLEKPIDAQTGLRLISLSHRGNEVEAITYSEDGGYRVQQNKFRLAGELGCTAAVNLGFFLLKEYQGITTRQLGVLFVFDKDRLEETFKFDLPVADDPITEFCRVQGFALKDTHGESDCEDFPECKNQPGHTCAATRAKCRPKA